MLKGKFASESFLSETSASLDNLSKKYNLLKYQGKMG